MAAAGHPSPRAGRIRRRVLKQFVVPGGLQREGLCNGRLGDGGVLVSPGMKRAGWLAGCLPERKAKAQNTSWRQAYQEARTHR